MRHLSLEDLARLVDEAPEPGEAAHLRDCIACRLELAELRTQSCELAELPPMEPPAALWDAIEARLTADGVLRDIPAAVPAKVRVTWWHPTVRTAAAAVLLVLAGGAAGWLWRGPASTSTAAPLLRGVAVAPPRAAHPVDGDGGAPLSPPAGSRDAGAASTDPGLATFASGGTARQAARGLSPQARAAERALRRAEADYATALRNYAELADPASGADAATRLRALDGIVAATGDALNRDPGDPVANGYHLAAMDERQRVLKQVAAQNESTWY